MPSKRPSPEEELPIARLFLPDQKVFALSRGCSVEPLARSVGNLSATVVWLADRGMNCRPWRTAMMMVLRIKKQFAVRRRHRIGARPISQEA